MDSFNAVKKVENQLIFTPTTEKYHVFDYYFSQVHTKSVTLLQGFSDPLLTIPVIVFSGDGDEKSYYMEYISERDVYKNSLIEFSSGLYGETPVVKIQEETLWYAKTGEPQPLVWSELNQCYYRVEITGLKYYSVGQEDYVPGLKVAFGEIIERINPLVSFLIPPTVYRNHEVKLLITEGNLEKSFSYVVNNIRYASYTVGTIVLGETDTTPLIDVDKSAIYAGDLNL